MPHSAIRDITQADAAAEYSRRAAVRHVEAARLDARSGTVANLRLLSFAAGLVIAWLAFESHVLPAVTLLVPVAAFAALVVWHDRLLRAERRAIQAESYWRRGLARIADKWQGSGATGEAFAPRDHVYASDLDLFGNGSLFQLLSTARTHLGEGKLASWLLVSAALKEIRERQDAVAELCMKLDLREDLATTGLDVAEARDPEALLRWAESPVALDLPWLRVLAPLVGAINLGLLGWIFLQGPLWPFLTLTTLEGVLFWRLKRVDSIIESVSGAADDLRLASRLLARIEREQFSSSRLQQLRGELEKIGKPPSQAMAHLAKLADYADSRTNWVLELLNVPILYTVQVSLAIEAWRKKSGSQVRRWLEALAEIEALCSLAAYAYEHPADPFPELIQEEDAQPLSHAGAPCLPDFGRRGNDAAGGPPLSAPVLGRQGGKTLPLLAATELGHPLLPEAQCIRNSVHLGEPVQVLLVSGSNMSGKSTLLRAVGISVVMAVAGAPVRARRLRLTPLQLGTCIRVTDSLQQGKSGFYAEITRLRRIMDLTGKPAAGAPGLPGFGRPGKEDALAGAPLKPGEGCPERSRGQLSGTSLLFLCDELLHGTNSHDRRIGAEGILRALIERRAIGVVTTHDLALTAISEDGRVRNAHFEDQIANGEMRFDYKLRDGVVAKSNALELMRSVGLEV